jgi:hypothetical protein
VISKRQKEAVISKRQKTARRRRDEKSRERWLAKQAEAALRHEMRQNATDIFVDGNKGDDRNDGLTPDAPLGSLRAAMDSLPAVVDQNFTLHLARGVFKIPPTITIPGTTLLSDHAILMIDGGSK